ncbi:GRP family sugar transporter [Calditerrivibrio sp.]|uniref:GRP family sugar transporter n=1 Tax=Calditerrivibrio sp. TaxID=2792612 RepID=UPI003D09BB80
MYGITLIIISALMHAMWNFFLKKSSDKHIFNYQMHMINLILMTLFYPTLFNNYLYFETKPIIYGFMAGIFFSMYHLFLSKSYKTEDVSKVYPITTSSPIFVSILAMIFLKEKISILGFIGIITVILGILILNMNNIGKIKFTKGVYLAILASMSYSFGAIIEKSGVGKGNIFLYIYSVTFFMTLFLFIYSKQNSKGHLEFALNNINLLLPASIVLFLSVVTYRFGLERVSVSYATSIRQINALFGVIIGILFLKEPFEKKRILGALTIILGIIFIKKGM